MQDLNIEQFRNLSDSEIRLVLTLAYLKGRNNGLPPLHDETLEIEKFYTYVKQGRKVKDEI